MVEPYRFFNKPKSINKIIRKMPEVKFSLLVMCTTFIAITLGIYYYKIYTCTSGTMDTEKWNPDKCFIYPEKGDDDDYEYEDSSDNVQAPGPIGPGPGGPGGPPPSSIPQQPDWATDFRIDDEDGTAWAEADDGTWYFWNDDRSEWEEWGD